MRPKFAALTAIALLHLGSSANAAADTKAVAATSTPSSAALLVLLSQRFPDIHFRDIHPSATIPGWFELGTDTDLVYSDASGEHLFVGYVVSTQNRENLTAKRWSELNAVDFKDLPLEHAIKTVRGNGLRQLVIFEDPLCPFCRQLEKGMADLNDVTIYTFLFPLESIHPGATVRARQIWCSADRTAVWNAWMQRPDGATDLPSGMDENGSCGTDPVSENRALGQQLRINATPTLVFTDGSRIAAAVSKDEIEKRLALAAGVSGTPVATALNAGAQPARSN